MWHFFRKQWFVYRSNILKIARQENQRHHLIAAQATIVANQLFFGSNSLATFGKKHVKGKI